MADGRRYADGTIVLRTDQPYGNYVKDLFELQKFPPEEKPYDTCGWTLPLLLGVRRVEVIGALKAELQLVKTAEEALTGFRGDERAAGSNAAVAVVGRWRQLDERCAGLASESVRPVRWQRPASRAVQTRRYGCRRLTDVTSARMPRIGVYAPWTGSMDEGWLRWTLDHFKIPFVTVRNETLRRGRAAGFARRVGDSGYGAAKSG